MMNQHPLLSICIATYNRARFIGDTLESIVPQLTDDTELLIVDGASPDDTQDIVQRYASTERRLRYVRLSQKGGVDQDYCKAVELAEGKFCWLFTDDDIMKPGAIKNVIDLLSQDYDLVIVNAEIRDQNLLQIMEDKHLHIKEDKTYGPSLWEDFFKDTVSYMSFIGSVVINRSVWDKRLKEPYYGTEFIHIGVIFQQKLLKNVYVMAEPLISIRYGNAQWASRFFEVWMIKWPDIIWSFLTVSTEAKLRVCSRHPWKNLQTLLLMRAYAVYSLTEYHRFIEGREELIWRRLLSKAIAVLPGLIPNSFFIAFNKLIGNKDFILWHSLKTSRFYYRQFIRSLNFRQ